MPDGAPIRGRASRRRITSYNVCYTKLLRVLEFGSIDRLIQSLEMSPEGDHLTRAREAG